MTRHRKQIVFRETKGNEPRIVPIEDSWIEIVESWLRIRGNLDSGLLFVTLYGGAIDVRSFSHQFHRYCDYAGITDVSLHSLRHYSLTGHSKNRPVGRIPDRWSQEPTSDTRLFAQ